MQNDKDKFKKDFRQRLITFSLDIIKLAGRLKKENNVFYPIVDQVIRSGTSIGANVIEAKASSSKKDYIHYFEIALKSANETQYWLILIKESVPVLKETVEILIEELDEISRILGASVLTLKRKNVI